MDAEYADADYSGAGDGRLLVFAIGGSGRFAFAIATRRPRHRKLVWMGVPSSVDQA